MTNNDAETSLTMLLQHAYKLRLREIDFQLRLVRQQRGELTARENLLLDEFNDMNTRIDALGRRDYGAK